MASTVRLISLQPPSKGLVVNWWKMVLSQCTPDMWKNVCMHCAYTKTIINLPLLIISLEDSTSDSKCDLDEHNASSQSWWFNGNGINCTSITPDWLKSRLLL